MNKKALLNIDHIEFRLSGLTKLFNLLSSLTADGSTLVDTKDLADIFALFYEYANGIYEDVAAIIEPAGGGEGHGRQEP